MIDPLLVDDIIDSFLDSNIDYLCNNYPPTFPDGLDIEVFSFSALEYTFFNAEDNYDLEHVTPFIRKSKRFKISTYKSDFDYSKYRWTVDEKLDFELVKEIFDYFSPDITFSWTKILKLFEEKPELYDINKNISRNEGSQIGTGQKLYKRAKNIIPGGTMLLSKKNLKCFYRIFGLPIFQKLKVVKFMI